jgi:hypothetical protein
LLLFLFLFSLAVVLKKMGHKKCRLKVTGKKGEPTEDYGTYYQCFKKKSDERIY